MRTASTPSGYRAFAGNKETFGADPREALERLLVFLPQEAILPIVILPYNRGDVFFSEAQQTRLLELKSRRETLTLLEQREWEALVEASFEAATQRAQSLKTAKS